MEHWKKKNNLSCLVKLLFDWLKFNVKNQLIVWSQKVILNRFSNGFFSSTECIIPEIKYKDISYNSILLNIIKKFKKKFFY